MLKIVPVKEIPKANNWLSNDLVQLYNYCLEMEAICSKNDGVGLSAVQVGLPFNFFVVKHDNLYRHMVNCSYEPLDDDKFSSLEGCLSIRSFVGSLRRFEVPRYRKVRVKGKALLAQDNLCLSEIDIELNGYYAVVYQHEIDHANDILISQIGKEIFVV
jgi:peptide deformylase